LYHFDFKGNFSSSYFIALIRRWMKVDQKPDQVGHGMADPRKSLRSAAIEAVIAVSVQEWSKMQDYN
jgi:hypothetical protein